jgi:hypothetical protein
LSSIFERLVGLETEYAIRFHPRGIIAKLPTKFALYQALVDGVRRRVMTVEAKHFKEGVFTANGGAIWFEATAGGGLVEGATPECRGPRELLTYQRMQDHLLSEAASEANQPGELSLIKNDRDSQGNIYGAQENYETELARGFWLVMWRLGLVALAPMIVLTWLGFLALLLGLGIYFVVAGLICFTVGPFARGRENLANLLFGSDETEEEEITPGWLETALMWMTRILTTPLASSLYLLLRVTAFRPIRYHLLPFLVSRCVIGGSGMVDDEGDFRLADKADAMNCVFGYGGYLNDRPIFIAGHFLKTLCLQAWFSPREYFDLFDAKQRLQIGLGDSNMADVAEYLRVGTTLLTIDAIEAGYIRKTPRLARPIQALEVFNGDPTLQASVIGSDGKEYTAMGIQRYFLEKCQHFVDDQDNPPKEAVELLVMWRETLDLLETSRDSLVGSLDWVTKQYLLQRAGADARWDEKKKIDLKYHELTEEGYFQVLKVNGVVPTLVDVADIQRAVRIPPPNTPATTRAHYIREFGQSYHGLTVNWKTVTLGTGSGAKVIRLSQYGRKINTGEDELDQEQVSLTDVDDC